MTERGAGAARACARSSGCPAPVAGARATSCCWCSTASGWEALRAAPASGCPSSRRCDGRADHHRGAVDHAGRAHLDHHRAPAVAATASPASASASTTRVLNAIRWQRADGSGAPDPPTCSATQPFGGRAGPGRHQGGVPHQRVHRRAPARRPTSTAGRPPSVLVEHVRAAGRRRRAVRVRVLPGCRRGRARVRARRRVLPGRARGRRPARRARCSTRCPTDVALVVTADHGQVQRRARRLDRASARSTRWSTPTRATGASATSTRAAARPTSCSPRPRRLYGDARVGLHARPAARRGLAGPGSRRPGAGRRVGDVVLAARDAVGFVDPTLPQEAEPDRPRTGRSPAAEMQVPLVAGPRPRGAARAAR